MALRADLAGGGLLRGEKGGGRVKFWLRTGTMRVRRSPQEASNRLSRDTSAEEVGLASCWSRGEELLSAAQPDGPPAAWSRWTIWVNNAA
jgi:hypothetical protein